MVRGMRGLGRGRGGESACGRAATGGAGTDGGDAVLCGGGVLPGTGAARLGLVEIERVVQASPVCLDDGVVFTVAAADLEMIRVAPMEMNAALAEEAERDLLSRLDYRSMAHHSYSKASFFAAL